MDTQRPEAAKPRATFALPSLDVLRALDRAHEQGFSRFCDERNLDDHHHASEALVTLIKGVSGKGPSPNYYDPYVAAAYMVKYHLSHCIMAYWAFGKLFDCIGCVPNALYVCDVGAGTGAARIGLASALSERRKSSPTIHFDAFEPSDEMCRAADSFVDALPERVGEMIASFNYGEYSKRTAAPKQLPPEVRDRDDVLRVVTAFHLSLPYDDQRWG